MKCDGLILGILSPDALLIACSVAMLATSAVLLLILRKKKLLFR